MGSGPVIRIVEGIIQDIRHLVTGRQMVVTGLLGDIADGVIGIGLQIFVLFILIIRETVGLNQLVQIVILKALADISCLVRNT